jgi:quercetin dioxygenase-like cupin family protein
LHRQSVSVMLKNRGFYNVSVEMEILNASSYFVDLRNAPRIKPMDGLETTILTGMHGKKMMMVLSATLPNHTVPVHAHSHEQVGLVYSGKAILRIGDEERIVKKGDFYCIPANVPHSDVCIGDKPFIMLDIFYPLREDFIQKLNKQSQK